MWTGLSQATNWGPECDKGRQRKKSNTLVGKVFLRRTKKRERRNKCISCPEMKRVKGPDSAATTGLLKQKIVGWVLSWVRRGNRRKNKGSISSKKGRRRKLLRIEVEEDSKKFHGKRDNKSMARDISEYTAALWRGRRKKKKGQETSEII